MKLCGATSPKTILIIIKEALAFMKRGDRKTGRLSTLDIILDSGKSKDGGFFVSVEQRSRRIFRTIEESSHVSGSKQINKAKQTKMSISRTLVLSLKF
ncbi:hypothetical protein NPIL_379781 [Nephila pilipes]|uniref:Uncharacterized protein n=1 Tax=Nephila pilipes TaxID=299642 RepID=A0A8X6PC31_NEPPI|nr:hypothetical protein NPIL_379781 [Nephila pilipes]